MSFRIHNLKLKPWNNSCEFVFTTQLQHYTSSPIHLKDDAKQNKDKNNNNKDKRDTTKGKEVLIYGCFTWLLRVEKKIAIIDPNNTSIFVFQCSQ